MVLKRFFGFHGFEKITNLEYTGWPNKFSIISVESYKFIMGLRILRNGGTSRGTSGTLVNRKLFLVPQYPYKNQ